MSKNENNTIKFLIYILVFLIIVLLLLIVFVIPGIKSYKSNSAELKLLEKKSINLKKREKELKKELDILKKSDAKILTKIDNSFDIDDFINYSKKYLKDVNISIISKQSDIFAEYNLTALTLQKSPKAFYQFLDSLQRYKNIIKIDFPIEMVSKKDHIVLNFHIKVLKNREK